MDSAVSSAAADFSGGSVVVEPVKRGRGRPPGSKNKPRAGAPAAAAVIEHVSPSRAELAAAAEMEPEPRPADSSLWFDLARSNQKFREAETFFAFCAAYRERNDPSNRHCSTYIYRLWPVIDRRKAGHEQSNIGIEQGAVTEQWMLHTHGSGKYQCKFNDSSKPKGLTTIATGVFELRDVDYPPVVDLAELDTSAESNRSYVDGLKARGLLDTEGKPVQKEAAGDAAVKELASLVRETVLKQQAGAAPIDTALQIADRLHNRDESMSKLLLELLSRQQAPAAVAPAPAVNPWNDLKQAVEALKAIGVPVGGRERPAVTAPASEGRGWVEVLANLPNIFAAGASFLGALRAMAPPAAAVPHQGYPPAAPPAVPAAWYPPAAVPPAPAPAPADPPAGAPADVPPAAAGDNPFESEEPLNVFDPRVMNTLMVIGERAIKAFNKGISGEDFAIALCVDDSTESVYLKLVELGAEGILGTITAFPAVASIIAGREDALKAWLQEFVAYGTPETGTEGQ